MEKRLMERIIKDVLRGCRDVRFAAKTIRMLAAQKGNLEHVLRYGVRAVGKVDLKIWDPAGRLKIADCFPNLVVNTGLYHIADQMSDQGEAAMSHMAVGTGSTAAAATDTALVTELDRNALDSTTQGGGASANQVSYVCTWAAGDGTGALREAGIFNQAGAGIMLCRTVFSAKNKGAGDTMTLTWTLTIS